MRAGIAAVGMCAWDRLLVTDYYPEPGHYAVVRHHEEQAGGTTANTCAALARLGLPVMLASCVGDDPEGAAIMASLQAAGCDTRYIHTLPGIPSDASLIVISGSGQHTDRTIFWIQGARPTTSQSMPVEEILEHRWVLLDVDDHRLREFWLGLPAHRSPRTRLIGTMTYLVELPPKVGWQHALSHDILLGNEREIRTLTNTRSLAEAIARAQRDLAGSACQAIFVSRGANGSVAIRRDGTVAAPAFEVDVVDTTGAGDAFAAGCIWGLLDNCEDKEILRRGNALGGLACRALGARAALPSLQEAQQLIATGTELHHDPGT